MISESSSNYSRTQTVLRQKTTKQKTKRNRNKNEIEIKLRKRTATNFTHDSYIDNKIDRITSWKKSKLKTRLSLIPNIFTIGLLHFFSLYNPYLYILLYCEPAQPNICDFFLVDDKYGYSKICKSTIIYINSKDVDPEIYELINEKDSHFITMFEYCSNRYEYNHSEKLIIPLYFDLSKSTNKNIKNFYSKGISDIKKFEIQKKKFGLNVFNVSNLNLIEGNFYRNDLIKFAIIIISITLYIISGLYADAGILIVLSFIYMFLIGHCVRRNYYDYEKHEFSLNKKSKITYLTKRHYLPPENICNESSIPSEQIVPGDILYLKNDDLVPCDVIILEGDCSISKSDITGKISLHRKKALEYNDEYFNYKKNAYCIILHGMKIIETQSKLINKCICVLCINTGYNTFKNNQISNLYFLKTKNENYNRFTQIFSHKKLFYYIYDFILCAVSLTIFLIKYFYDKKHNHITNNQSFWKYFGEIIGICLMPIYHVTQNIIKVCSFINLQKYNINCIDEARLLEAGNINTIFFDKTDTLSDNKIEICNFFPVYLDQSSNLHFNKNDITYIKNIRYEHLQFYRDFIIRNSLGNNTSNFTSNYNENDLSEYKQKYRLSSLFVQILVCCVNLEKINENICGNAIEQDFIKIFKFDLNTTENSNLKNICVNDIENELYSAINIDADEVRNIINSNIITDSNIIDTSSNVTNNIINEEDENKEEKDNILFNHIFNIINTSNNRMRYSSKNRKILNSNLKETKSNTDNNNKSDKQSNIKQNKECYIKNKTEKSEEDKNYEIYSRNHPDKKWDLLRIREIIKKLTIDFNINLPKINEIFPKNYYKIAESMKIGSNLITKKNNVMNPFKLIIIKKFFEKSKKRSALAVSSIVYNTLDHSLRFMTKGPPDKILRYCKETTYPNNVNEILTKLYREGSRTIALATKKIDIFKYRHGEKEEYYMNNLVFCGFVSLKSKLKKETKKVIAKLKDMRCDILINTGDSIFNSMGVGFESQIINDKNIYRFELLKNRDILISQVYKSTKNFAKDTNENDSERSNESENGYNNINSNYYGESKSIKMNRRQKKYMKNNTGNDGSFIINSNNRLNSGERPSNISYIRSLKKSKRKSVESNMGLKDESLQYKKYLTSNEIKKPNTESTIIQKTNSAKTENEETKSPPLISGRKQNLLNAFNKLGKLSNAIKLNNGSRPYSRQRKNKGSIINSSSSPSTIVECKNFFSNLSIKNDNNKINILLNTDRDVKEKEITATDYSNKSGNSKIKSIGNKQIQEQNTYCPHLSGNMCLSSFIYRPEMLNDSKFKHNVIFCVEGEVFNFVKSQATKKNFYKYDKLLKFFKHFCKIFYSMSVINKSELVNYFVSLPMKNVCMVGDESNDIDAILSANVGIKIVNKNDINSLLCHFLVDKTENNLEAIEIILKYGRAFYENSYYLINCSIIFTTIEILLILYSLFLGQNIKGYQMFIINIFILSLCLSGFTAKPDIKIDYNNIMSNQDIFSLLKKLNIWGLFIIKGLEQFILFYTYDYNENLADKDLPYKVFLSELFILCCCQSVSTIVSYNCLSLYRKSFINNYMFLVINYFFISYLSYALCLSDISYHPKILDYLADFEYSINNIDAFDDYSKINLIVLCICDYIITFLYINLVKYFLRKKASIYDKKKTGAKIVEINEVKNSTKNH